VGDAKDRLSVHPPEVREKVHTSSRVKPRKNVRNNIFSLVAKDD